jgi:hypothetical protein
MKRCILLTVVGSILFFTASHAAHAQRGAQPQTPRTAKASAPIDFTGYWVSVVTEDWRVRMVTPAKGNYESVPLTPEGRRVANTWDPARDEASGDQCKAYGAPAVMRVPGRVRITWGNENTLRIDTEAGAQTRILRFGPTEPPAGERTWQGYSAAQWEFGGGAGRGQAQGGNVKVVTTHLRPGYLRKNGVPYSANAVLNEYYDRITGPGGEPWLIVTTEVVDPIYLTIPFITSTHFKKLADNAAWNPEPCSAR